jgi:transposase InsO family protein
VTPPRSSRRAETTLQTNRVVSRHSQQPTAPDDVDIEGYLRSVTQYPPQVFSGVLIDGGSTGSVAPLSQLMAYRQFSGFPAPIRRTQTTVLRSMHGASQIIGAVDIRFPVGEHFFEFTARVVLTDAPLLLGLREMNKLGIDCLNTVGRLWHRSSGQMWPLVLDRGHLWYRWEPTEEILWTRRELTLLHKRFGHPAAQRLAAFIRRARPGEWDEKLTRWLATIAAYCRTCQHHAPAPHSLKVSFSIPAGVIFNAEVIADVSYLDSRPVLTLVDRDTRYAAAKFLTSTTAEALWEQLQLMWTTTYIGAPDILKVDRGSNFQSAYFQTSLAAVGIRSHAAGVEAAHQLGTGERFHGTLKRLYSKVRADHPNMSQALSLAYATKGYNDTQGPDGLVPTLLVYGSFPKLPYPSSHEAAQPLEKRMAALATAREEYERIVTAAVLARATKPNTKTPAMRFDFRPGDKVLVWRKRPQRWNGPYRCAWDDGVHIHVQEQRDITPYARECVRGYAPGLERFVSEASDEETPARGQAEAGAELDGAMQEPAERAAKSSSQPRDADFGAEDAVHDSAEGDFRGRENLSVPNGQDQRARANLETARTAAPPAAAQTASGESANAAPDSGPTAKFPQSPVLGLTEIRGLDVFASEVVTKKHPRWGDFTEARQAEVTGLERNRTYDEVRVPVDKRAGLRIFPSRFVDTIKNVGTPEEALKSRIVVQATAARDPDKGEIFTFSPTARRESFRTVVALAATLHLQLYTRDVSQAYVSSDTTLSRTVFVIPPKALRRDHTTLWRLRKGLYGLPESGLLWYEKYRSYHTSQLRMNVDAADPCLYSRHTHDGRIDGMIVTQVDDSLQAGRESFMADEMRESSTFLSKGRFTVKASGTNFNGVTIVSTPTGFNVHQHQYIEQMPVGPCPRNARDFATLRGMASYATANTRPDVVCAVNMLSQVTPAAATEDNFISLDEAVLRLKNTPVSLRYEDLDADSMCLYVYGDASFSNNPDLTSQIGHLCFLVDKRGRCCLLSWSSHKCRRVTRSVLAAELYALSGAYDHAFTLRHTLESLLKRRLAIFLFTDSRTLFSSITTLCKLTEKRLLIDIAVLRDAYRTGDLDNLCWVESRYMLADPMTKVKGNEYLSEVLTTFIINHPIGLWVRKQDVPTPRTSWFD